MWWSAKRQYIKATILDKSGRVLSVGTNSYTKTHPIQYHYAYRVGRPLKQYLHAEISAIIKALKRNKKLHKIIVERYGKDDNPLLAKPCPVCMEAIIESGIRYVTYTTNDGTETIDLHKGVEK